MSTTFYLLLRFALKRLVFLSSLKQAKLIFSIILKNSMKQSNMFSKPFTKIIPS